MIVRDALGHLARLCGVQRDFMDSAGQLRHARPEVVREVLGLLGEPVENDRSLAEGLQRRRREIWQERLEPVRVAWGGRGPVGVRIPEVIEGKAYAVRVVCEDGSTHEGAGRWSQVPTRRHRRLEGAAYLAKDLPLPEPLPMGYHRLELGTGGEHHEALLLSAPTRVYDAFEAQGHRGWGVFLPLYALQTRASLGAGDFADLEKLIAWLAERGGDVVASLPLLASLWELGGDISPYAPTSRLFWNEFYLDLPRIGEYARCPAARRGLGEPATQLAIEELRHARHVDYARLMALKRRALEAMADLFWSHTDDHRAFDAFLAENPEVDRFARFRAVGERLGEPWPAWPEPLRSGTIGPGDSDEDVYRYHLYVQWQTQRQVAHLAERARQAGVLWYLDLPVGVGGASYDLWRWPESFVPAASVGAPPDPFFSKGQNWGLPPMHPRAIRRRGYAYFIASLRNHLRFARLLRIDHVMGLHRLFWIPPGVDPHHGVYVTYDSEEMFAILCIETHRHRASVVGEDLGTVPAAIDHRMKRHGVTGMYVGTGRVHAKQGRPFEPVPPISVASLGTHDTPMFHAWWRGLDIERRLEWGLLDEAGAEQEQRRRLRRAVARFLREQGLLKARRATPPTVLSAWLAWLGASPAQIVLATLEDLWGETEPQNMPGLIGAVPNWQRKARLHLEELAALPAVTDPLQCLHHARRGRK